MEIFVDRDDWVQALLLTSGIVDRKHTSPILANLLVNRVEPGLLSLTASDREMEISCTIPCRIEGSDLAQVTLPTKKCLDICRSFGEGTQLRIKVDLNRATIFADRARFTLSTLPPDEFPLFAGGEIQQQFNVPGEILKNLISKTSFAMAQQDVRFYLNGLLFSVKEGYLTLVGADGHRMAVAQALVPSLSDIEDCEVIIPRKAIHELQRLLIEGEMANVALAKNFLKITSGHYVFYSRLVDSKFPDYRRIIPNTMELEFTVNRISLKKEHY